MIKGIRYFETAASFQWIHSFTILHELLETSILLIHSFTSGILLRVLGVGSKLHIDDFARINGSQKLTDHVNYYTPSSSGAVGSNIW